MARILQNTNLFRFDGFIGRGNFFVNWLLAGIICSVFALPLIFSSFFNGTAMSADIMQMIGKSPTLAFLLYVIAIPFGLYMNFCNISKRVADIRGKANTVPVYALVFVAILFITLLSSYMALNSSSALLASYLTILLYIILGSMKGLTHQDYNADMAKFNWGAFFGTWMWGIQNKTPITFWAIPAFFTFTLPIVAIIFGIKGNEWAYKKRNWEDMKKFHDSQSTQALVWLLLTPVLWVLLFIGSSIGFGACIAKYVKNPANAENVKIMTEKMKNYADKMLDSNISSIYSEIKFEDDEYKFFVNPRTWVRYDQNTKVKVFNLAADYAASKNKEEGVSSSKSSKYEVLSKTKIYSSYNNELIAEFEFDEASLEANIKTMSESKLNILELAKLMQECYKFNEYVTVP